MVKSTLPSVSELLKPITDSKTEKTTEDILNTQFENLSARLGAVGAPVDDRGPIGRLLNLEQNQGMIMDIFEVIDRPGQAVKGALAEMATGGNVATGFLQGLAGQTDRTGVEFLVETGALSEGDVKNMSGVQTFMFNMATDILTDPLTYIPAGLIKRTLDKLNPFEIEETLPAFVANVEEVANTKRQFVKTTTDELIAGGMDQAKAAAEAKKRAGLLSIEDLEDTYNTNKQGIETVRKRIDELAAQGKSKEEIQQLLTASEAELYALDDFVNRFEKAASDLKIANGQYRVIRRGGPTPGVSDIEVLMDIDGEYFKVAGVEVKQTATAKAYGKTYKMAKGADSVIDFGENVKLTPESRKALQDNWSNITVTVKAGNKTRQVSVADAVTELIEGSQKGKKGSVLLNAQTVSPEDLLKIQEGAREVLRNAGWDYMYIIAKDGSASLVHFDDIVDNISVNARFRASEATRGKDIQTRLNIDLGLDTIGTTPNAYGDLFNEVFRTTIGSGDTVKVKVGFLDWASQDKFSFSGSAKKLRDLRDKFFGAFNAFFDISEDTTSQLRRLSAESQMYLHNEGTRMLAIKEEAIRRAPNAEEIVSELIQLNAKFVNGNVIIPPSFLNVDGVLKNYLDNFLITGSDMSIPIYGARAGNVRNTAKNAIDNINDAVRSQTGIDDAFRFVEKEGLYALELNQLSPEEFKHLMGKPEFRAALNEKQIRLGTKSLTDEYIDFYRNNADIVDMYRQTLDDMIKTFRDELGVENLPDFIKTSNAYSRHLLSERGAEYIKASQPLARSPFIKEGTDFLKARKYFGTGKDVNKAMRVFNDVDFDFFDPSITNSLADLLRVAVTKNENGRVLEIILKGSNRRGVSLFQVIDNVQDASLGTNYKYITSFENEFSKMYKNLSIPDQKVFQKFLNSQGFVDGKALAIHNTAFETLKRVEKAYVEIPELLKGYDKAVTTWKGLNLITPTFHLNSFLGNSTNMYLAGMGVLDQGTYIPRSTRDLTEYNRILTTINEGIMTGLGRDEVLRNLSVADNEVYDRLIHYFQSGASMKGRGTLDIGSVGKTLQEGGQKNLYDKVLAANFSLAENIDEVQRYALFQWAYDTELAKLKKAGGLSDLSIDLKATKFAENKVMESLFDYSHFTQFEQDVMKRIIPFYTFMKNNLVFQMRNLLKNPQQYGKLGRAYNYYVSEIAGISEEDMPEYARNNLWLPIPLNLTGNDKETITFLKASLPPGEFAELIESRGARAISGLTIPLKLPIELALNRDIFTGAEIKEFAGQRDQMQPGTGVASFMRDERGMAVLSSDPVIQKISADLGFRVPARYITTALGIADTAAGYKDPEDAFLEALNNLGILSVRETQDVRVTNLYQALQKYREAEKRWEQSTGIDLPSKAALGLP